MKRNVVFAFCLFGVLVAIAACGKGGSEARREPEKILDIRVTIEGEAEEAFELLNADATGKDGIKLMMFLKAKKPFGSGQLLLRGKSGSGKPVTVTVKGEVKVGLEYIGTGQMESGESSLVITEVISDR